MKRKNKQLPWRCGACGRATATHVSLIEHINTAHKGQTVGVLERTSWVSVPDETIAKAEGR